MRKRVLAFIQPARAISADSPAKKNAQGVNTAARVAVDGGEMSTAICDCGHEAHRHALHSGACGGVSGVGCDCIKFESSAPVADPLERIAVALESIAKSLAAMRLDGPR